MKKNDEKRKYSQIVYLFWIYAGLIVVVLGVFFIVIDAVYKSNIYSDAKNLTTTFCTSIENAVEAELNKMSNIAINVEYSDSIRDSFEDEGYSGLVGNITKEKQTIPMLQVYSALNAAQQNMQSASQVNVYTLNQKCIGTGFVNSMSSVKLLDKSWYSEALLLNGKRYITVPENINFLENDQKDASDKMYISFVRLFNNRKGKKAGFVEVIQDCDRVFALINQLSKQNPHTMIYIFNDNGDVVYPYKADANRSSKYYKIIYENEMKPLVSKWVKTDYFIKSLATYNKIEKYNWSILVYEDNKSIYYPLHQYRIVFLTAGAVTILLVVLMCYYLSRKITRPLREIRKVAKEITITTVLDEENEEIKTVDSNIVEIHQLCESIRAMYEQLQTSSREVLLSRSEETKARLSATQSLINPHFLYNCLTHISIMAEEEMNDEIVEFCNSLCDFFRYISSTKEMKVPLWEELICTQKYIECMKVRYGDDLIYECNIEDAVKDIEIPKFIVQPIVENAFKYGFNKRPPWILRINAYVKRNSWRIEIEDNGGMLGNEEKERLLREFRETKRNALYDMEIGGLGLKNTYLRLKLLYGEEAVFTIENHYPQRTKFILGGPIGLIKEKGEDGDKV